MGHPHPDVVMHFWAFCDEELAVFLIIIPIMFVFKRKTALNLFVLIALASIAIRFYTFYYLTDTSRFEWYTYMQTHLNLFGFCFGSIVALSEGHKLYDLFFSKLKIHWIAILMLLLIGPYFESTLGITYMWIYKPILSTFCFAIIVAYGLYNKDSFLDKIFGSRLLVYLGGMYYSLYIWQQPYTFSWFYVKDSGLDRLIIAVILSLITGLVGYYLLELPLKKLRKLIGLYEL